MILVLLVILPASVSGASVTLAPRSSLTNPGVTFKVKFGYVNVTNTQRLFSIPTVNSNGTITFDLSQNERYQVVYLYTVLGFSNGTLNIRFNTDVTPSLVKSPGSSLASYAGSVETVQYTDNVSHNLELDFVGPPPSVTIPSAIAVAVGFFALLVVIYFAAAMAVLVIMLDQDNRPSLGFITRFGIAALVAITFALITLVILATFTGVFKGQGL